MPVRDSQPSTLALEPFYHSALLGLRALEAWEGRGLRFSPEADSRWQRFRGQLHEGDRLQMLLRDASVPWGLAFAGARVFSMVGVARDEPFGPQWTTPSPSQARRYLDHNKDASPTLEACAHALAISPQALDLPPLSPVSEVVVAGGTAILALAEAFAQQEDLDWSRQVTVVASNPAHRQLAGLAAIFIQAVRPCDIRSPEGFEGPKGAQVLMSEDAEADCVACLSA